MPARILIVDDDHEVVSVFQDALEIKGYEVEVAYNGETGWEKYQDHYYDVVIVDWKMGEMSGMQLLKNIDNTHPHTKVIMVTGFGSENSAIEAHHCHAFDYLKKPVDMEVLLQTVQDALRGNNLIPSGGILIVDDDHEVVSAFQDALEMEGHNVDVAYNGEDGWEKYQRHYYDVVIVDWKMGKMSGMQVLENIDNLHLHTRVIMVTGFGDEKSAIDALHRHAFDYLKKPVRMGVLLQAVHEAMTRQNIVIEALEEWVETHPEKANQPQLASLTKTGEMQVWSAKQVLEEIKRNTPFGRKEYKNLIKLTTDLLTRGKLK